MTCQGIESFVAFENMLDIEYWLSQFNQAL